MDRLLICECGNKIVISNAQAGRQVVCGSCNAQLQVPTLRGLAELPVADSGQQFKENAESANHAVWRWRGPVMAVSFGALILSLGFAIYNLRIWYSIDTTRDVAGHLQMVGVLLESAGPDQLSQMWDEYSGASLTRPSPPIYKLYSDLAQSKLRGGLIACGISAVLLLSLVGLWFSAPRPQRKSVRK